jgi:flagellar hook-associated protein 3 FlgL
MMINRLATQEVAVTKQLSDNEDIDYERVITEMITQESIHQAALSVGAKIIQSTLVDFIR